MERKKQYLILKGVEFALAVSLFVIPPLFATGSSSPVFSVSSLVFFLAVQIFLLFAAGRKLFPQGKKAFFFVIPSALVWCALMVCMFILRIVSGTSGGQAAAGHFPPALFIAGVLLSAFYEESLYRWYVPLTLLRFIEESGIADKRVHTALRFAAETAGIYVFAFAHSYMGPLSVVNAFAAGILLRLLVVKTESPITSGCVHFCYNIAVYLLLALRG